MLLMGNYKCIPNNIQDLVIFNYTSMMEGVPKVNILPSDNAVYASDKDFDLAFANYIFNNPYVFYEFFGKIIYNLYLGYNVYILIMSDEEYGCNTRFLDCANESLMKLIQQRYSYYGSMLNDPEDIYYINQDQSFSTVNGVYNLDQDKERFAQMYTQMNSYIDNNGNTQINGFHIDYDNSIDLSMKNLNLYVD